MKYMITAEGVETESRSDKAAAITRATQLAKEHKATVEVATDKGTVVHVAKARKPQKRTKPFTRVDARDFETGEGVKLPKGFDVAYLRPRSSLCLLRKAIVTSEGTTIDYRVFDLANGASVEVGTTREAGAIFRQVRKGELELTA